MLSEQEKKELIRKRDILNKEITSLRKELNQINDKKVSAFDNKEKVTKTISTLINTVKSSKSQRNQFTKKVREVKQNRSKDNKEIREKIEEIKKLNKQKIDIQQKHDIKKNPSYLKKDIDKLEYKLETEPTSFDKEKKLTKVIKDLKKQYKEVKVISDVFEKINKLDRELKDLRKKANEEHRQVQKNAHDSQEKHELVLETSKEIDDMKGKEEQAYKNFFDTKKRFTEISRALQEKLQEISKLNVGLKKYGENVKHQKEESAKKSLKEKAEEVNKKFKEKKKLTTEDLLVLQGLDK
jgi:uncharacterized coiled-coil DUF342 family protein